MKSFIVKLLFKYINIKGMLNELIDEALEPALKKVVADTENPYDDMLLAATYQPIENAVKAEIGKLVDSFQEDEEQSA